MIEGDIVFEIIRRAHTRLPEDVLTALKKAQRLEKEPVPKLQLKNIIENVSIAGERGIPMCQDTGVPLFFLSGREINTEQAKKIIQEAYSRAEAEIPLRPNLVDPLTRSPSSNGVHICYENSYDTIIQYLPKGAGSENMSRTAILLPSAGEEGILNFILETVKAAGGKPCPPIILGIGIGGTADHSAYLAKKALLKPISKNTELEEKITEQANSLGIGPMGLGGKTTCLGTNIETFPTHTASLPITVNIQCWANRHCGARIITEKSGNKVEYIQ